MRHWSSTKSASTAQNQFVRERWAVAEGIVVARRHAENRFGAATACGRRQVDAAGGHCIAVQRGGHIMRTGATWERSLPLCEVWRASPQLSILSKRCTSNALALAAGSHCSVACAMRIRNPAWAGTVLRPACTGSAVAQELAELACEHVG
eukprot:5267247-Pyramimonas_sp.AAC.1